MKFIIKYDYGYGEEYECVALPTEEDAEHYAYEQWREGAEANADYGVIGEWTQELEDEYM